jgi:hypothetical protein
MENPKWINLKNTDISVRFLKYYVGELRIGIRL